LTDFFPGVFAIVSLFVVLLGNCGGASFDERNCNSNTSKQRKAYLEGALWHVGLLLLIPVISI
jgi:hypothetical protein